MKGWTSAPGRRKKWTTSPRSKAPSESRRWPTPSQWCCVPRRFRCLLRYSEQRKRVEPAQRHLQRERSAVLHHQTHKIQTNAPAERENNKQRKDTSLATSSAGRSTPSTSPSSVSRSQRPPNRRGLKSKWSEPRGETGFPAAGFAIWRFGWKRRWTSGGAERPTARPKVYIGGKEKQGLFVEDKNVG